MHGEVLILDDDPAMLSILEGVLSTAGYRCHVAGGPEQALSLMAKEAAVKVVISDIYMPGMTGLQFVDRLLTQRVSQPMPRVLLLTAQPSVQVTIEALRLGVCDFLIKPVRPPELLEAVKRAMAREDAERVERVSPAPEVEHLIRQAQELTERLRQLAVAADTAPHASLVPAREGIRTSTGSAAVSVSALDTIELLRRLRGRYEEHKLDDVAWDLLLELVRAERQQQRISVSGLMVPTSNVSSTTLLRRINELTTRGYVSRIPDPDDARRDFVSLTPKAREVVTDYLEEANQCLGNLGLPGLPFAPTAPAGQGSS